MKSELVNSLNSISPIDGRYHNNTIKLSGYFSEKAFIRYRIIVEIEYFISLVEIPLPQLKSFPTKKIKDLKNIYEKFTVDEGTSMVLYTASLWYNFNAKTGSIPIHSSIKYGANGRYDDDFSKKVATDALTKGLSKLGFNADVFMGLFDDNKYVNDMKVYFGTGIEPHAWKDEVLKA